MASRLRTRVATLGAALLLLAGAAGAGVEAPVADAAMRGDAAAVRALIRSGADVNAAQGDGMTALHWAAQRNDADQVRMLVAAGARVEAVTRNGNYVPLHLAARAGAVASTRALLDAGANVNVGTSSGGATALHFAAGNGWVAVIEALLEKGAPVDARDAAYLQTPLMWAAAADRVAAVQLLVNRGAQLAATSKVQDIPLLEKQITDGIKLREKKMAAVRAAERPAPKPLSPKDSAVRRDSLAKDSVSKAAVRDSVAKVRAAAPKDSTVQKKGPVLSDSAKAAKVVADSIKNKGFTYGELVGNKGGLSALHFAVRQGHRATVEALLAAGADVNQQSAGDHTSPLLMASINGQYDLAMLLVSHGADPRLASDAGNTPLYATVNTQWAPRSDYPQPTAQLQQKTSHLVLMEALIAKGANVNARLTKHLWFMMYNFDILGVNTEGATPFWRAAYGTDVPAMKLLIAHGADPMIPTVKPRGRERFDDMRQQTDSTPERNEDQVARDSSGLPPVEVGGNAVYAIHAASGVGYGDGFAANSHNHAPDGWMPALKYLVEELGADVNQRDHNGYTPLHHAAARGDNAMLEYLVSKGACITVMSRRGRTVADMANGPVQRIPPFLETVALAEKLGSRNHHTCRSC